MDESVLSAEMCNHYIIKLREITDDISTVRNELETARQIIELNWVGESGQAANGVVNRFDERFKSIENTLSDDIFKISGMIIGDIESNA